MDSGIRISLHRAIALVIQSLSLRDMKRIFICLSIRKKKQQAAGFSNFFPPLRAYVQ